MTEGFTALQHDILDLESQTWNRQGEKLTEFRRRHPLVTEIGYYVALRKMLSDPTSYQHENGRYAALLARLDRQHTSSIERRHTRERKEERS